MILSHFGDVTCRCVTQITVDSTTAMYNRLHNGHVMGTEESGRYGEVGVLYDNFLGEYMFFLC